MYQHLMRHAVAAGLGIAVMGAVGCGHHHHDDVSVGVDVGTPVAVQEDPPVAPVEVVPVAPGPDVVWIGGEYVVEGGHYRWHPGHYERGRPGHHWVASRYERTEHGYVRHEGHWE